MAERGKRGGNVNHLYLHRIQPHTNRNMKVGLIYALIIKIFTILNSCSHFLSTLFSASCIIVLYIRVFLNDCR